MNVSLGARRGREWHCIADSARSGVLGFRFRWVGAFHRNSVGGGREVRLRLEVVFRCY